MALLFTNNGEFRFLRIGLNHLTPTDLQLALFTDDIIPDPTILGLTEPDGGGYAKIDLLDSSWTITTDINGKAKGVYPDQTFVFTGPLTGPSTIYGYMLMQKWRPYPGNLLAVERFIDSFTPVSNGDSIMIPLVVTLFSEF